MSKEWVGSLGLILDIIGVCILFRFGFPQPDVSDAIHIVAEGDDPNAWKKRWLYYAMSGLALVCLVAGFGLQLSAVWM
jgi:hypothetical protein